MKKSLVHEHLALAAAQHERREGVELAVQELAQLRRVPGALVRDLTELFRRFFFFAFGNEIRCRNKFTYGSHFVNDANVNDAISSAVSEIVTFVGEN